MEEKERKIERHLARGLSKEACAVYSLMGNVGFSALEFVVGFISGSFGLIADAVHTAVDILASAITWIGIEVEREAQAALLGGVILCGIGTFIAIESATKIFEPTELDFQFVALATIIVNIAVNGFFTYYKFYVGGRTRSISLVADAYHTKTDIWSSAAVLVGILGAAAGFPLLDAVAGVAVSLFIISGGGAIRYLKENNIKYIKSRVKHPQTNGKIEKWYDTYEKYRFQFENFDKFVNWYNTVRYHESLDTDHYLMTPNEAFWTRLPEECKLNQFLERMERELNEGK